MKGVIGGETQASQVSSLVGSSLNFDLEENLKALVIVSSSLPLLTRHCGQSIFATIKIN